MISFCPTCNQAIVSRDPVKVARVDFDDIRVLRELAAALPPGLDSLKFQVDRAAGRLQDLVAREADSCGECDGKDARARAHCPKFHNNRDRRMFSDGMDAEHERPRRPPMPPPATSTKMSP